MIYIFPIQTPNTMYSMRMYTYLYQVLTYIFLKQTSKCDAAVLSAKIQPLTFKYMHTSQVLYV